MISTKFFFSSDCWQKKKCFFRETIFNTRTWFFERRFFKRSKIQKKERQFSSCSGAILAFVKVIKWIELLLFWENCCVVWNWIANQVIRKRFLSILFTETNVEKRTDIRKREPSKEKPTKQKRTTNSLWKSPIKLAYRYSDEFNGWHHPGGKRVQIQFGFFPSSFWLFKTAPKRHKKKWISLCVGYKSKRKFKH